LIQAEVNKDHLPKAKELRQRRLSIDHFGKDTLATKRLAFNRLRDRDMKLLG
jgi:large subunit ribosomal protein L17